MAVCLPDCEGFDEDSSNNSSSRASVYVLSNFGTRSDDGCGVGGPSLETELFGPCLPFSGGFMFWNDERLNWFKDGLGE